MNITQKRDNSSQKVELVMNTFGQKILVVAAHPDDEMLGCGGTIAALRAEAVAVTLLLLGEGPAARGKQPGIQEKAVQAAREAAACLNVDDVRFGSLPDNAFDSLPLLEIIRIIEDVGQEIHPDTVFTHHIGDLNIDHRRTHEAVMTAFRPLPGRKPTALYGFEVLSSTDYTPAGTFPAFMPTVYVDISQTLKLKQRALAAYAEEMRPWPFSRSHEAVEHLARLRGASVGLLAAEAFTLYRQVITRLHGAKDNV